jgi:hypothetical protein
VLNDETFEAWIVGAIGENIYVAPEGAKNQCHALRELRKGRSHTPTLWLACEPVDKAGTSPAVLIGLTIGNKSPDGTASQLDLKFRQYGRKDRMPRPDAMTRLILQYTAQEERGRRVLWRNGWARLHRQSE